MSIKPINYSTVFSKSQEVSKINQTESDKTKLQVEQGFIQQENKIKRDKKRVVDTNKNEPIMVGTDDRSRERQGKKDDGHDKKEKQKDSNNKIGGKLDIKI